MTAGPLAPGGRKLAVFPQMLPLEAFIFETKTFRHNSREIKSASTHVLEWFMMSHPVSRPKLLPEYLIKVS